MIIFLAGNTNDRSSPTLVIVIVILVVIIVLIIILFLVCLYRGRTRELPCRSVRCGRKSGRSKANGNQGRPEDANLLESLSKNPIYQVSFKKGSEDIGHLNAENGNEMIGHLYDEASNKQRGHLYDEARNEETGHLYDEARNEETSHLYAEVPGSLGWFFLSSFLLCFFFPLSVYKHIQDCTTEDFGAAARNKFFYYAPQSIANARKNCFKNFLHNFVIFCISFFPIFVGLLCEFTLLFASMVFCCFFLQFFSN